MTLTPSPTSGDKAPATQVEGGVEVVLLTSVSGMAIEECALNLVAHSVSESPSLSVLDQPHSVEEYWLGVAEPLLEKTTAGRPFDNADVLALPYAELCDTCEKAFGLALGAVREQAVKRNATLAVLSMHPVLYHQQTTEFAEPYRAASISRALRENNLRLRAVVSVHDDVYSIYQRLLRPGKLFDPKLTHEPKIFEAGGQAECLRNARQDLEELRLILDWRDRELSCARALARGIGCRHLLFHRNGRVKTLWDIIGHNRPCAYFSHPISQPRRDLTGVVDPDKCRTPSHERGKVLVADCQNIANLLGQFIPLVEPTAIDEYRIDFAKLGSLSEKTHLQHAVLPPLTERWPMGGGDRLGGQMQSGDDHLTQTSVDAFRGMRFRGDAETLGGLDSAARLLGREIRRQINVRDNALAEQADLVIAFRPFSLPDSPQETGGVDKEIRVLQRKIALGKPRCKPSIIVINPPDDERRRRSNEFDRAWPRIVTLHFAGADKEKLEAFKNRCREIMVDAPLDNTKGEREFVEELVGALEETGVEIEPEKDASSMALEPILRSKNAAREMAQTLLNHYAIVRSRIEVAAAERPDDILWLRDVPSGVELGKLVRQIVEKGMPNEHG